VLLRDNLPAVDARPLPLCPCLSPGTSYPIDAMDTDPTLPTPSKDPASSLDPLVLAGLGVVLAVRDRHLEREVAAKLPRRGASGADEHLTREARLAAALEHPSILPVYDLAEAPDGAPLMVMRRAPGRSLEDVLSAGERPRGVPTGAGSQLAGRAARSTTPIRAACSISTSSPPTSASGTTARSSSWTGAWPGG
jgi:hypothetical protein